MLSRVVEPKSILPELDRKPESSVRVSALLKAYGTDSDFFEVWERRESGCLFARFEGTFFVGRGGRDDYDEVTSFLHFQPAFARLAGSLAAVEAVAKRLGMESDVARFDLMRLRGCPRAFEYKNIEKKPDLKTVYNIIAEGGYTGAFQPWYVDISHRVRHGCARAYLRRFLGRPAAACLVSAESDAAGLISGVTTRQIYRGRGFAHEIVSLACVDLKNCGKLPVLECFDALRPFYEELGFEKAGDVAELDL